MAVVNLGDARVLGVLLVFVLVSWWWSRSVEPRRDQADRLTGQQIDYFAEHITVTEMNEAGAIERELQAARVTHYADTVSSDLEHPRVVLHKPPKPPWIIQSEAGTAFEGGDRVVLTGRVRIYREASMTERPVDIRTEWLEIRPDERTASTDHKVDMVSASDRISGVGMEAQLGDNTVIFFHNEVHSRHESH